MRKTLALLVALLVALSAAGAPAEEEPVQMRVVTCPEQGFSTLCRPEYTYDFHPDGGLTLCLDEANEDPLVTIFKTDGPGADFDAEYYLDNVYPSLLESYGDEVLSPGETSVYTFSDRRMPGRMSMYVNDGEIRFCFCAFDLREDCFVRYEVFSPQADASIDQALTAMAVAVGNFRPDAEYYANGGAVEPEAVDGFGNDATPEGILDYTDDILQDGTLVYRFQELSLYLPASWQGKLVVVPSEDSVSFCQRASYEKYREEGFPDGGFLFGLGACGNNSFTELPSFAYLGFSKSSCMDYYLILPSDYPAYMDDDIRAEYDAMFSEISFVLDNVEFHD